MDRMGRYIYGVISHGQTQSFPLEGVVPFAADSVSDGGREPRAYTVSWQDISAVVTEAPVVDYTALPKDALGQLLVRHQQVIEKVMARHTIVPLRLGTCVDNDEQVQRILASGYDMIRETLQKARAVVEIDVTAVLGDLRLFLRHVAQAPPIVQWLQALQQQPGGATIEDQMKIGQLVQQHADREKQRWAQEMRRALDPIADDFRTHDLMDDRMVLNAAFLLRKDRQQAFDRQVEELNTQFRNQLDFRCVGPLPPYSFYTLEVKMAHLDEVDWARRQLGLYDKAVTVEAIKQAHRRAARTCHPDKNPDVPDIEKKFAEMSRAYRILLDYYRTSGRTGQGAGPGAATQEETAVLVTLR